jgi:hypothetical protein
MARHIFMLPRDFLFGPYYTGFDCAMDTIMPPGVHHTPKMFIIGPMYGHIHLIFKKMDQAQGRQEK